VRTGKALLFEEFEVRPHTHSYFLFLYGSVSKIDCKATCFFARLIGRPLQWSKTQ